MVKKTCCLKPLVSFEDIKFPICWKDQFSREAPLVVEIGFGMGEVLLRNAQSFPENNYIGIEQHWERIYKTLQSVTRVNDSLKARVLVENIKILKIDARFALEAFFNERSISSIYCLFPCPWPKKGHIKHRLFSSAFLKLLNSRLVDKGDVRIVTDFYPYLEWVGEQIEDTGFKLDHRPIKPQFQTKFEKKWVAEGQEEFFEYHLQKVKHQSQPVPQVEEMKIYKINSFDFKKFDFVDVKSEVSVILKEKVYDELQKKAMLRLIVSEKNLTQPLWVNIIKKDDCWSIKKGEGQIFFPTPGIAKAIELIYLAAKNTTV